MTDKILKEAYDKLTAIEEADDYVPQSKEERERERSMRDARNSTGEEDSRAFDHVTGSNNDELEEASSDDMHTKAIDLLDNMLNAQQDQYGEQADILRYAIKRLQEVGLGR